MSDSIRSDDAPATDITPVLDDAQLDAVAGGSWDIVRQLEDVAKAVREFLGINPDALS